MRVVIAADFRLGAAMLYSAAPAGGKMQFASEEVQPMGRFISMMMTD